MKNENKTATAVQINYHFNWGCGGYNSVMAYSMEDAMEKAINSSFLGVQYGIINLEPDEDFKITRASDKACQGMFD